MDKPTSLCFLLARVALGLFLITALSGGAVAQDGAVIAAGGIVPDVPAQISGSGSFFNRQLGTPFRFRYHSEGYGTDTGVVSLGTMKVFSSDGSAIFLDGQATLSDSFGGGFNSGIGYRTLTNLGFGPDPKRIHGVSFWTDGQSTENDNFFTQLGFSLESLGDSMDVRLNGQFPLDRTMEGVRTILPGSTPVFEGNELMGAIQTFAVDTALSVVDVEAAKRISDLEAWAFLGGYHLGGGGFDEAGYRAGVRGYAVPDVAVSLQVTDDNIYHTNVMFGITWFVGRTNRCNEPCGTLLDRFREPVQRNDFIALQERIVTDPINPLTDATTNEQFFIVHVDSSAAAGGDGTFEMPFNNLTDAETGSAVNNIVLTHADSVLAGSFALKDGQRFLGEGNDIVHTVNSAEQGIVNLPETAPGALSATTPIITGAGDVFTMANNNEVNNFTINGGTRAIVADSVASPQAANLAINMPTGDAISLTNVTGSTTIENSVMITDAGGVAILVDGGSGIVGANAEIVSNIVGRSVEVRNRDGGSVTFGLITDTADGILVEENTGGTVTFSSLVDLDTAAMTAVTLSNNDGATVTFQELDATSTTANTFVATGGGTINVNDAQNTGSMITNTGTGSAVVLSGDNGVGTGDPTVTIAGDITNTGDGRAVDAQFFTAGGLTVTGAIDDTDGTGSGILVQDNSGGVFSFNGTNTLTTGANNAVTLQNNDGATITFDDLAATSTAGNTFVVNGGGAVNVNDTNDVSVITNNGLGTAVRVRGSGGAFIGDPTVSIAADVTNTVGGMSVDIQDMTAGGVTFSGLVNDTDGGVLVSNNTGGSILFTDTLTVTTGSSNAAVELLTNTGTTLSFNGLVLNATGPSKGFSATGGGNVTVTNTNPTTITSVIGTALELDGMTIDAGGATFDTVNQSAGTSDGIILTNIDGTGGVVIGSGTNPGDGGNITTTMTAISVNNAANLTVDNVTVNNTVGAGVNVTGQVAGSTATFNGLDITTTNGDAVTVENNTDGTIAFNSLDATTTGTGDLITLNNNAAATVNINGMEASATGAGNGFTATGTGNLSVSGTANLSTNTGQAINIDSQSITAAGANFNSVNTTSATTNGVTLNNLGGTGAVTVGSSATVPGTIISAGSGVVITGSSNDITIGSDVVVTAGGGRSLDIQNRTGGTVDINGTVTDSGAGARIAGNTSGTVNVNDAMTFNTGANPALTISGNNGGAVNIASTSSIDLGTTTGDGVLLSGTNSGVTVDADITGGTGDSVVVGGNATATFNGTITNTAGRSVHVTGLTAGTATFNGDINDTGSGISIDTNTGGTTNFNGTVTLNTAGSDALTITGNGAGNTTNFAAGSQLDIDTTIGRGIVINGPGTVTVSGTGNTVDTTTGVGIDITNAGNATINNTTVNAAGSNAVDVTHNNATDSRVTFNSLTVASAGAHGVNILANGSSELDLLFDNADINIVGQKGLFLDTGASADRVDFTLTNSDITAVDDNALQAVLDDSNIAEVRLFISDNQLSNSSGTAGSDSATVDIAVTSGMILNATIGDSIAGINVPPTLGDKNRIINNSVDGTPFAFEVNNVAATVNLDLRDNTAQGGNVTYFLTNTAGTFNLVDGADTISGDNNIGTVTDTGPGVINDIAPPVLLPTP